MPSQAWSAALGAFGQRSAAGVRFSPALQPSAPAALPADVGQQAASELHSAAGVSQAADCTAPAAWLITGGAGALGLLTAAWLAGGSIVGTASAADAAPCSIGDNAAAETRAAKSPGSSNSSHGGGSTGEAYSGQPCGRLQLVLTSRSGRLAAEQQPGLAARLWEGSGPFAACCITIARSTCECYCR